MRITTAKSTYWVTVSSRDYGSRKGVGLKLGWCRGYLGDEGAHPHAAWDDSVLPLLCGGGPLARDPQLLVHLLSTARVLP